MLNFCTLFDSHYLSRGLAMYESLIKHCKEFHLYIFAFDDICLQYLKAENLDKVTIISLTEFEDKELLAVKESRTKTEYCWTCTPSTILYCINTFALTNCTYLDADLYFFSDPKILIDEMCEKSVLITEHRYTPIYDLSETSGIYCVQFMTFKNDSNGMIALKWWRNACVEWCFATVEEGKFGDQKYLDDWPIRFEGVHILQNLGGGVAPWNIQQYTFHNEGRNLVGQEVKTNTNFILVFYHFHSLKLFSNGIVCLAEAYLISKMIRNNIYKPYILQLMKINKSISIKLSNPLFLGYIPYPRISWWKRYISIKEKIIGIHNNYHKIKNILGA